MSERLLLALTEEIYEAATGGMPWAPVGRGLMRLVGAESASLMALGDGDRAEILFRGDIPLDAVAAYRDHYRTVDLWTNRAAAAVANRPEAPPRSWISGTLVSDAEFLGSEFYADFGRALGLRYVVGTVLPLGAAGTMPVGLHRSEAAGPFERAEALLLDQLLPHLRRAMQLRHRLEPSGPAGAPGMAALDALAVGVLVVDAELRVLVANAAAEAMAGQGGPFRLARNGGVGPARLSALRALDGAALAAHVRATALAGAAGGAVALHDADDVVALAALVSPLPRRLTGTGHDLAGRVVGQALVLLRRLGPEPEAPRPTLLRELFGLTQAEAEVALMLAGGATKEAVAARRAAKSSTVRTQVRAILAKTGATNLRALERLLAGLDGA